MPPKQHRPKKALLVKKRVKLYGTLQYHNFGYQNITNYQNRLSIGLQDLNIGNVHVALKSARVVFLHTRAGTVDREGEDIFIENSKNFRGRAKTFSAKKGGEDFFWK